MTHSHRSSSRLISTVAAVGLLACFPAATLEGAVTATFGGAGATHANTVKIAAGTVTFDLSAIGKAQVYRARIHVKRPVFSGQKREALAKVSVTAADKPLPLAGPRYKSFDASQAVAAALKTGRTLTLKIESLPGWDGKTIRLEVAWAGKAPAAGPAVSNLKARHRRGQTILTFDEFDPPVTATKLTIAELRDARKKLAAAAKKITYRIYRCSRPISAKTIGQAVLIDEIGPLTCWNGEYYGIYPKKDKPALRYVVEDGKAPVRPAVGIYAHNPPKADKAWYAVTVAVNGTEDLDKLGGGNTAGPIEETVGPGEPILQRTENPAKFMYHSKPTLRYYVRWEAPPRANVPSRPFDYLLAVPDKVKWPAPICMAFHCWGGSLNGGYGWWYNRPPATTLLLATNQIPYDWWTGYHEAKGTWKSWSAGVVRSYTQKRYDAFFDWVCANYRVDRTRTIAGGNSMGGSGAPVYATHRPGRVAWVSSWVGVHTPAGTPHFLGSYELCYGRLDWKLRHESGQTAFQHFDDAAWIRNHPEISMPLICFGNGKDDGGIGWPQALAYFRALQEARQPHVFRWALGGHGVRATLPGPGASGSTLPLDVRTDQSLPALTKCSIDGDPGTGRKLASPAARKTPDGRVRKDPYDGDPSGYANRWLYWETGTIVDKADRWEMTVKLMPNTPADKCTVYVTPRRLQQFKCPPGRTFAWTNTPLGGAEAIQSGKVTADKWGLVTLEKVQIAKAGNRLQVHR